MVACWLARRRSLVGAAAAAAAGVHGAGLPIELGSADGSLHPGSRNMVLLHAVGFVLGLLPRKEAEVTNRHGFVRMKTI